MNLPLPDAYGPAAAASIGERIAASGAVVDSLQQAKRIMRDPEAAKWAQRVVDFVTESLPGSSPTPTPYGLIGAHLGNQYNVENAVNKLIQWVNKGE